MKFTLLIVFILSCSFCSAQLIEPPPEQDKIAEYAWLFKANDKLKCGPSKTDIKESKIEECKFLSDFKVYPNPSNGNITLSFEGKAEKTTIIISDLEGRGLYVSELEAFTGYYEDAILLEAKGLLIVSIIQGKEIFTKKLIVK